MKLNEFEVGREFTTAGGRWRCTDVGGRVVVAIQVGRDDPTWLNGPPYVVQELVFDENDIPLCYLCVDTL